MDFPGTTADLVSGEMIRRMKPGSYLVNTSRGLVVNLDDLMIALEEGRIRGAALDVLEEEPPASFYRIATHLLASPHPLSGVLLRLFDPRTAVDDHRTGGGSHGGEETPF
ncbi:MAG: hypothetical protein JEY99_18705 [Spirochaetales bacterium]|nr:hypothetical protein [Spirochaetales bacterium]